MSVLKRWPALCRQQKLILIACISLFLPFYITCMIHVLLLIYALLSKDLIKAVKNVKNAYCVLPFTGLSLTVSFYYGNWVGMACSFIIFILLLMICYFQYYGDKALLNDILHLFVFMSVLCGIYGLMEYNHILGSLGYKGFEIIVMDSPKSRLNSVFFNANYYAMMIEFFVMMTFYLILQEKNMVNVIEYAFIILFNLFLLYLSGCRTAWSSIVVGIFVLLFYHHDKRWFFGFFAIVCFLLLLFIVNPDIFPRSESIDYYLSGRIGIWKVSLENIKSHLFFGEGPLTYMHIYSNYTDAQYTQHAHNIFIDPVLSYGIVGVSMMVPYFKARWDEWKVTTSTSEFRPLMIAILAVTLCHGLLDYTVYFVPTGFTFLMILSSSFVRKKANDE